MTGISANGANNQANIIGFNIFTPTRQERVPVTASPLTEFFNSRLNRDSLFVGISAACQSGGGSGCIRSLDITSGFPAAGTINNVILNAAGGTGTITIDNNSGNAEASSVYHTTLSGATIVKATQSGLQ